MYVYIYISNRRFYKNKEDMMYRFPTGEEVGWKRGKHDNSLYKCTKLPDNRNLSKERQKRGKK